MEWTNKMPTKEGWYWNKISYEKPEEAEIAHVNKAGYAKLMEDDEYTALDEWANVLDWYGPISPPIEQEDK